MVLAYTTTVVEMGGVGSTGKGGVVGGRLRSFLRRHGELLEFLPGEEVDRNPGHTLVVPPAHCPAPMNCWQTRSGPTAPSRAH